MVDYGRKIPEWPEDERPRERLIRYGADALSEAELLAILLRTGSGRATALDLAREILTTCSGLRRLDSEPIQKLMSVKGVGAAKACQIKAAFELAKRLVEEKWKTMERIQCSDDAFHYIRLRLRDLPREVFRVLFLTNRNDIIEDLELFSGGLTESVVSSREIVRHAVRTNAASVILVHNHPSGEASPSPEDRQITGKIVQACRFVDVRVLDHIIVGKDHFFSFADQGLLS